MNPHPETGSKSFATGDINLVATLMAVGVPLDQGKPCELIENEAGSYGRFFLLPHSLDGKFDTETLMQAWSGKKTLNQDHPFVWLMEFISKRPRGIGSTSDWMAWAVDHCRELEIPGIGLPRHVSTIADFVAALPDARQSYIFAFVANRHDALGAFLDHKRVAILQRKGESFSLIDRKLPLKVRNELLSRLEGE
jgi:hypothetical protein